MTREAFQREMKKFDPLLRIRRSFDRTFWLIERKCRHESLCLRKPLARRGYDAWVRDRDGFIEVTRIPWDQLDRWALTELRAADMWAVRGAGWYADQIEAEEAREQADRERQTKGELEDLGCEAYDRLRSIDGGFVGFGGVKHLA